MDGRFSTYVRYSPDIPGFSGYTDEEYRAIVERKRIEIVLASDRERTAQAVKECL